MSLKKSKREGSRGEIIQKKTRHVEGYANSFAHFEIV